MVEILGSVNHQNCRMSLQIPSFLDVLGPFLNMDQKGTSARPPRIRHIGGAAKNEAPLSGIVALDPE